MNASQTMVGRSLISGTVAALATAAAASLAGKREAASYTAPLNATSHVLWGDEAARHDRPSFKYTVTGYLIHHAASIFWATIYEEWLAASTDDFPGRRQRPSLLKPLAGAALISVGAYVTDYYLVPKRFTPGFEKRLSGKSLAVIYGSLALGFAASSLMRARR